MKKIVGQKQTGLYIKDFNLFVNVYEPGLMKAVRKANIERIMHGYVDCGSILEKDVSPENFYNNFEVWNILSNYITKRPIRVEEGFWQSSLGNTNRKTTIFTKISNQPLDLA